MTDHNPRPHVCDDQCPRCPKCGERMYFDPSHDRHVCTSTACPWLAWWNAEALKRLRPNQNIWTHSARGIAIARALQTLRDDD